MAEAVETGGRRPAHIPHTVIRQGAHRGGVRGRQGVAARTSSTAAAAMPSNASASGPVRRANRLVHIFRRRPGGGGAGRSGQSESSRGTVRNTPWPGSATWISSAGGLTRGLHWAGPSKTHRPRTDPSSQPGPGMAVEGRGIQWVGAGGHEWRDQGASSSRGATASALCRRRHQGRQAPVEWGCGVDCVRGQCSRAPQGVGLPPKGQRGAEGVQAGAGLCPRRGGVRCMRGSCALAVRLGKVPRHPQAVTYRQAKKCRASISLEYPLNRCTRV